MDALTFALDTACAGTWLEKTRKNILITEAQGICEECGSSFIIENYFSQCPECKGFSFKIKQGKELRVKSISID